MKMLVAGIKLSSDFIAGFCGETEEDHLQTLSMLDLVRYHCVFYFPYSLREVELVPQLPLYASVLSCFPC